MNKNLIILIIVAIVLAGAGYFYFGVKTAPTEEENQLEAGKETEAPKTTAQEAIQWNTASTCAYLDNKKDISFIYPQELKLDAASLQKNCLSIDPGIPNFTLPISNNSEIATAELTTDLKNIFYIKVQKDAGNTTYSLYRGDLQNRKLVKLDSYTIKGNYQPEYNIASNSLMPRVVEGFLTYNWFIKDPMTTKYVGRSTDFLRGKISSLQNNLILFTSPCDVEFSTFPPTFDIAPDGKHIVLECKDGIYLSDWKTTHKILLPTSIGTATRISFIDVTHLGFVDSSKELEGCRSPSYSIDLNGQNLKETGSQYMCY